MSDAVSETRMLLRLMGGAGRAQLHMTRRNIEDLQPLLVNPLFTLVSMAILVHSGRVDLAGWSLVASLLMTVGGCSFLVASELLANERSHQTFELVVASPSPYAVTLATRILLLTSISLVGFVESWVLARLVFGVHVVVYHPMVLIGTMLATVIAATGTALLASPLFCFGRTTRTYQNAVTGPLYLLGGVLVPVSYLPDWVRPISRGVFFYWSADLLRDSLRSEGLQDVWLRIGAIAAIAVVSAVVGSVLLRRMLNHLRREGTLGLA